MLICMRTTVVLDDGLLRKARKRAADTGLTLGELVNLALRDMLATPEAKAPHFEMITYGRGRAPVRHEPGDFAQALEDDDALSVGRKR
jgi:hypothetical protein